MASTLCQKLYLGGLPSGLNMTITDVKPSVPDSTKWRASFSATVGRGAVSINENGVHSDLSNKLPITVATSTADGLIGKVWFESQNPFFSHGIGGKVDIAIRIQGTTKVNGNSYTVDQMGYISVSASNWFLTRRPNDSYINYSLGDTAPGFLSISVPPTIAGMPEDVYFVFVLSADGKQIGVSTTLHKELILKICDGTIETIFFVHGKVLDWVVGLIPIF